MALFVDKLTISSPDFEAHGRIPFEVTADGGNRVPRLEFSGPPDGAVEYAIVCHDPDAPLPDGFSHWTVYGIPVSATSLDVSAPGVRQGPNDLGEHSWYGPQPPHGHGDHHYFFWVYALRRPVEGAPDRATFLTDYADAIIEQARIVGVSRRD